MLENSGEHIISKKEVLLRPGFSRRFSFRGTPGGKVTVRSYAIRLYTSLGDTITPVDIDLSDLITGPVDTSPVIAPILGTDRLARVDVDVRGKLLTKSEMLDALMAHSFDDDNDGDDGLMLLRDDRPVGDRPWLSFNDGELFDVGPLDPPVIPEPEKAVVRVRLQTRDGQEISAVQNNDVLSSRNPFTGQDIIDVVFTNANPFPIKFTTHITVQNELAVTQTVISRTMLERVFYNTVKFLVPNFGISNGQLYFAFDEETQDTFEIDSIFKDIGFDADASIRLVTFDLDYLSQEDVIKDIAQRFAQKLQSHLSNLQPGRQLFPDSNDFIQFIQKVTNAFFARQSLPEAFENAGVPEWLWKGFIKQFPLFNVKPDHVGKRDDVAIRFDLRLNQISANSSVLQGDVDTINATLYMVMRSIIKPKKHVIEELNHDFIPSGFILPRFQLFVDVSDIDVEVDLGGGIFTAIPEWFIERGAEPIVNWIKENLVEESVELGNSYLNGISIELGEFATSIMTRIANRDHIFRRLRTQDGNWLIETIDSSQLMMPHIEPSAIDHRFENIHVNVATLDPIDGPMPENASERLQRVEHLVFLMMENRSFDHMLGYLSHPKFGARTDVNGLNGRSVRIGGDYMQSFATPQPVKNPRFFPNPNYGIRSTNIQIANGAMDGFVSEFARLIPVVADPNRILEFYTATDVPTYDKLSRTDMILDHWFCSVPGPTYPNRVCYFTGATSIINQSEIFDNAGYLTDLTLFDVLSHERVDWIVYESDSTFLRMFERYRVEKNKIRPIEDFFNRSSKLPPVTFIEPNFYGVPGQEANDDHPPVIISKGQKFIKRVIEKLQSLESWPKTMFVIMYDEHGGFADHIPPPGTARSAFPPNADGTPSVPVAHPSLMNYGPRVPALVVSPLVTAGGVGSKIYDHASVYRTVIERFMPNLRNSMIIPERVRRARHLGELIENNQSSNTIARQFADITADVPESLVRRLSKPYDYRPYRTSPPDLEDFHYFMTRLGNPLKSR